MIADDGVRRTTLSTIYYGAARDRRNLTMQNHPFGNATFGIELISRAAADDRNFRYNSSVTLSDDLLEIASLSYSVVKITLRAFTLLAIPFWSSLMLLLPQL